MVVFRNRNRSLQNFIASLALKSVYFKTGKHAIISNEIDYSKDQLQDSEIIQESIDYAVKQLDQYYSSELKKCVSDLIISEKLARLWYRAMITYFRTRIEMITKYCNDKTIFPDNNASQNQNKGKILVEYAAKYQTIMHKIGKKYSLVKIHNECNVTRRKRGYIRKLGITRKILRKVVPTIYGLTKSSW